MELLAHQEMKVAAGMVQANVMANVVDLKPEKLESTRCPDCRARPSH
jgi:hypothetical protein